MNKIPLPPPSRNVVICGDNLKVTSGWPDNCVDGICTDPPYGLGFMGKEWDKFGMERRTAVQKNSILPAGGAAAVKWEPISFQQWFTIWAKAMLRITKPGGFLLCFGGTRTFHRLTCAIEDAGWEIRDDIATFIGSDWKLQAFYNSLNPEQKGAFEELILPTLHMMWLYGSGFPKSTNISLQFDKYACREQLEKELGRKPTKKEFELAWKSFREVLGIAPTSRPNTDVDNQILNWGGHGHGKEQYITTPATSLAQLWNGYGTALKPAWEPIIVAMKPLDGTFANNAEKWGVAGLNIDGGRISGKLEGDPNRFSKAYSMGDGNEGWKRPAHENYSQPVVRNEGRWPANLILDEEAGKMLDKQSGVKKSGFMTAGTKRKMSDNPNKNTYGKFKPDTVINDTYGDSGGASRFFYCAKTSRKERNMGLEDCEDKLLARSGGAQSAEKQGKDEYLQDHIGLNRVAVVKNNHPTVKPLALMKYLCTLLKMPNLNQVILDPFGGSGTTGMACKELGINYIVIEKEQEYCEIARKRIAAVTFQGDKGNAK